MTITKEGVLASFYTVNKAPIKHLRVYFSPKQAGSEDPSPDNIRSIEGSSKITVTMTSKNLIDFVKRNEILRPAAYYNGYSGWCNEIHIDDSLRGTTVIYSAYIDATNVTNGETNKCAVWGKTKSNTWEYLGKWGTAIPAGGKGISQVSIQITDNTDWIAFGLSIQPECLAYNPIVYYPDTSITSTINFPSQTKNLFDPSIPMWQFNAYTISNDQITQTKSDGRGWTQSDFIPIHLAAGTYTLTCSDGNVFNLRTSIDNYDSNTRLENGGGSFTLTQDCDVRFKHTASSYPTTFTVQLEKGSSATTYEPFNNIIYGGYVDLITGELYKTWDNINISTTTVSIDLNLEGVDRYYISTPNARNTSNSSIGYILCDCFAPEPILAANENYSINVMCTIDTTPQRVYFYTSHGTFSYASDFKNYMADKTFVYELASPQLISTLTPQQLQTFIGRNNIWSNTDRVEVEYDLAESNDELYRRRNIILRGYPHIETVSGNIASFQTDLVAPIKDAKIYFNPIQYGNGDPSPDNIRNIYGWHKLESYNASTLFSIIPDNWMTQTFSDNTKLSYIGQNTFQLEGKLQNPISTRIPVIPFHFNQNTSYILNINIEPPVNIPNPINNFNMAIVFQAENTSFYVNQFTIDNSYTYVTDMIQGNSSYDVTNIGIGLIRGWENVKIHISIYPAENHNTNLINWQDTIGNVYGGYIDLNTGNIYKTYDKRNLKDYTFGYYTNYQYYLTCSDRKKTSTNLLSNLFPISTTTGYPQVNKTLGYYSNGASYANIIFIRYEDAGEGMHSSEFNNWLQNLEDNPYIVYELETPQYITTLSPIQLKTLKGTNNIWSDANGPVSITYWTH